MALAQKNVCHENKVQPRKVGLLLDHCTFRTLDFEEATIGEKKIVRLYKRQNTRVKKALRFSTKKSKAKLA